MQIDGNFFPPHSPFSGNRKHPEREAGHHLYHETAEFYAWFMSWVPHPSTHRSTFQYLSRIMRIAHVSTTGGKFLSGAEEQSALGKLSHLREELYNGNIHFHEIEGNLLLILHSLIQANPKAKLVAHATELEYLLCISNPSTPSNAEQYQNFFNRVIEQIKPELPDIHAQAIAQGLSRIVDNHKQISDVHRALNDAIKGWL